MAGPRIPLTTNLQLQKSSRWNFNYNAGTWACELECMRCLHQVRDPHTGHMRRCKRKTCYTLPYCAQHLVNVYHLRVGRTTLKDAQGRRLHFTGLFACDKKKGAEDVVFSARNNYIIPYVGELISRDTLEERYPEHETGPYTYGISNNRFIDGACQRGVGGLANMCIPSLNPGCVENNATFSSSTTHYPNIIATKTIRNGKEIFVSYGRSYFAKESIHRPYATRPESVYRSLEYKCTRR